MAKRNTYHSRRDFFWANQEENETPEKHWKKLITLENCDFKELKQEDLLIPNFITSFTDKKLREKLIRGKKTNLKTTVENITQNSEDRQHKQSTKPPALAEDNEIKQEPFQNPNKTIPGRTENTRK